MKKFNQSTNARYDSKRASLALCFTLATALIVPAASAAVLTIDLGAASSFAVLAGSGITVAGAVNSTTIDGDIGTFPTPSITGASNMVLNGVDHGGDAVTQLAKADLVTAYNEAAGRPSDASYGDGQVLIGTLVSGVYEGAGSLTITGDLILDAQGDPNAVWIFKSGSTLITDSNSNIVLAGGALASNIFWQVGSSATLGTGSEFSGTIMAMSSITLETGASLEGRALARNGAVTMDYNTIAIPEPSGGLLVTVGMIGLLGSRRRRA